MSVFQNAVKGSGRNLRTGLLASFACAGLIMLGGCETMTHEEQGEILGGIIGGVAGAQVGDGSGRTAAIIVGTIAGSMIGRHIGETMDDADRMKTAQTLHNSPSGKGTTWVNPDTGYEYTVTPTKTHATGERPCREFRLNATIGDDPHQEVYGTACLQDDGSWLVQ